MSDAIGPLLSLGAVVAAPLTAGTSLAFIPEVLGGLAAGSSVLGSINQEKAQNAAAESAQNAEAATLGSVTGPGGIVPQEQALAANAAAGPSLQSLIDAQRGGIETLQSKAGGVPNLGAVIKDLFGQSTTNALDASIKQRDSNLQTAGGILGAAGNTSVNAASQYGQTAAAAGKAASASNPYAGALQSLTSIMGGANKSTGLATGLGSTGSTSGNQGVQLPDPSAWSNPTPPTSYDPGTYY